MEIAIVAKAKQGYIYRYMIENKMTVSQLSERIGIPYAKMCKIINFRWTPGRRKTNDITERLEKYFRIPIEMLFPPELTGAILEKLGKPHVRIQEVELLSLDGINQKYLMYDNEDNEDLDVDKILTSLTPREEKVTRLLRGIGTQRAAA